MEVFGDYAYYYNAFYQDKDYGKEAETVDALLKKYRKDCKTIHNFGCGTGRHDIELAKRGYQCAGIDMSPLMIDIAKKNSKDSGAQIEFEVADVRTYEAQKKYDAVISLFHVMSYQNGNDDILKALQSARRALEPGGLFLFDVWYGPGVLTDKPAVRIKKIEDEKNQLIRMATPVLYDKKNQVDVQYEVLVIEKATGTVQTIREVHHMRYYFRPELEMFLKLAGFELIDNIDCQTLKETDYTSWTSYFIARAV